MTGIPAVSSHSRVHAGCSIDLAPAQTTAVRLRVNCTRSAEMSKLCGASRWTPPMPATANTGIPARSAASREEDTVVPPAPPPARVRPTPRVLTLGMEVSVANCSRRSLSIPTRILPPSRAIRAGTEPEARTAASMSSARSRLAGKAGPCGMAEDSRATTGRPSCSAWATSSSRTSRSGSAARARCRAVVTAVMVGLLGITRRFGGRDVAWTGARGPWLQAVTAGSASSASEPPVTVPSPSTNRGWERRMEAMTNA